MENTSPEKLDRKTQEKNRRIQMKYLSSKLFSLIPPHHHQYSAKDMVTQQDQIDQAITYIEKLKERVDVLMRRKDKIIAQGTSDDSKKFMPSTSCSNIKLPMIEVRELGSTIEVILVSCLQKKFTMQEVIIILEEEGVQVVTANFSTIGDKVYYTIHAQVKITRLGVDASRVYLRLQNLIC
ncbi:transcription factor bHLH162-like [Solanum lycopersicum]|uniref:BHLH domain-containing protein n=1 Tax=Solanum lycopersicum TaxID=4081 RepID=A0A3Q7FR92_SOLLC|nr:transcription factor bHLH162-like isoform X1 [Solanum lycopersicum]